MIVFKEISALKVFLHEKRAAIKTIGFVPTMGALHAGHVQLLTESKAENDLTVASVFVNPIQFNNSSDFDTYPRVFDQDAEIAEKSGVNVLFAPSPQEMYPTPSGVIFDFGTLDKVMEGAFRPGHFNGVATVVAKLFNIVEPDHAYFGQKDWQQFAIISRLVEDLSFNVKLRSIPTVREPDGLAMSSRNMRLTTKQREKAPMIFKALCKAKEMATKEPSTVVIKRTIEQLFAQQDDIRLEYFEIVNRRNLTAVQHVDTSQELVCCIAGWMGEVRLIDNIFM